MPWPNALARANTYLNIGFYLGIDSLRYTSLQLELLIPQVSYCLHNFGELCKTKHDPIFLDAVDDIR